VHIATSPEDCEAFLAPCLEWARNSQELFAFGLDTEWVEKDTVALLQISLPEFPELPNASDTSGSGQAVGRPGDVLLVRLGSWHPVHKHTAKISPDESQSGTGARKDSLLQPGNFDEKNPPTMSWESCLLPPSVVELLSSPALVAVGVGVKNDLNLLAAQWPEAFNGRKEDPKKDPNCDDFLGASSASECAAQDEIGSTTGGAPRSDEGSMGRVGLRIEGLSCVELTRIAAQHGLSPGDQPKGNKVQRLGLRELVRAADHIRCP